MIDFLKKTFHIPKFATGGIIEKPIVSEEYDPPEFVVNQKKFMGVWNHLHFEQERKTMKSKERKKVMTVETVLDALDSIVWYNGFGEIVLEIKEYIRNYPELSEPALMLFPSNIFDKCGCHDFPHYVWMMMVVQFGDYGTSPRYGWIEQENREEALKFLDAITKTDREYKERMF